MASDTEYLILQTARRHFVRNGFTATRMQDIADEAGINKALLHYYYRSKEKLYNEIISQILDTIVPRLVDAVDYQGEFTQKVERLVNTYIGLLIENPDFPFFVMTEVTQKQEQFIGELKKRAYFLPKAQAFMQSMVEEMESGKIRKIPPLQLLLNIMGMAVFPFVSRPIFSAVFSVSDAQFMALMEERKSIVIEFIHHALKPE